MGNPWLPTEVEGDKHFLMGHIPFRNWCPVCIRARGKESDHRQAKKERLVPEYSFDFCFPGDELGYKWTILVGKERLSGSFMATALPSKGAHGQFMLDRCLNFIDECGDRTRDIIIKTDQEAAIGYVVKGIVEMRGEGKSNDAWKKYVGIIVGCFPKKEIIKSILCFFACFKL